MNKLNRIVLILSMVIVFGCSKLPQKTMFTGVSEPAAISLHKRPGQKNIYAIHIQCSGNINGQAEIDLILNGKPNKTEELKGKVNFTWGGDWYSDSAEIQYKPAKVSAGVLNFKYVFKDL